MGLNYDPSQDAKLVERLIFDGLPRLGLWNYIFGCEDENNFLTKSLPVSDVFYITPFFENIILPGDNSFTDLTRILNEPYNSVFKVKGYSSYSIDEKLKIKSWNQNFSSNPSVDSNCLAEKISKVHGKIAVLDVPGLEGMPDLTSIYLPGGANLLYQKAVLLASERSRFMAEIEGSIRISNKGN